MSIKEGKNAERKGIRERERESKIQAGLFWFAGSLCFCSPLTPPKGGTHVENKVSVSVDSVSNPLSRYIKNESFVKR
jgi:hypothetical protein